MKSGLHSVRGYVQASSGYLNEETSWKILCCRKIHKLPDRAYAIATISRGPLNDSSIKMARTESELLGESLRIEGEEEFLWDESGRILERLDIKLGEPFYVTFAVVPERADEN